jgi:hypothetical protein
MPLLKGIFENFSDFFKMIALYVIAMAAAAPGGAPPRRFNYLSIHKTGNLPREGPWGGEPS